MNDHALVVDHLQWETFKEEICLFFSPHLDDVVLSCGGLIHKLVQNSQAVFVITVLTAEAPSNSLVSRLAEQSHKLWQVAENPFLIRRQEDQKAVKKLNADYLHLDLLSSIYRNDENNRPLYPRNTVNVPVHPYDWAYFLPSVAERILATYHRFENEKVLVFCPLGIGRHVDHLIVRKAIEANLPLDNLWFYEDFPYAIKPGALKKQILLDADNSNQKLIPSLVQLDPLDIQARISASLSYASQLKILFPHPLDRVVNLLCIYLPLIGNLFGTSRFETNINERRISSTIQAYLHKVGGERYWHHLERYNQRGK